MLSTMRVVMSMDMMPSDDESGAADTGEDAFTVSTSTSTMAMVLVLTATTLTLSR